MAVTRIRRGKPTKTDIDVVKSLGHTDAGGIINKG
jgi:hypothetical protein